MVFFELLSSSHLYASDFELALALDELLCGKSMFLRGCWGGLQITKRGVARSVPYFDLNLIVERNEGTHTRESPCRVYPPSPIPSLH